MKSREIELMAASRWYIQRARSVHAYVTRIYSHLIEAFCMNKCDWMRSMNHSPDVA